MGTCVTGSHGAAGDLRYPVARYYVCVGRCAGQTIPDVVCVRVKERNARLCFYIHVPCKAVELMWNGQLGIDIHCIIEV